MSNDFEPVKNEKTECKIEFNDNFKIPIYYNEHKIYLKNVIKQSVNRKFKSSLV